MPKTKEINNHIWYSVRIYVNSSKHAILDLFCLKTMKTASVLAVFLLASCLAGSEAFTAGRKSFRLQQNFGALKPLLSSESHARGRHVLALRGGAISLPAAMQASPSGLFNGLFLTLSGTAAILKLVGNKGDDSSSEEVKPANVKSLQKRFLAVFWLLRMADWLQGPYFYEVYASKIINGAPVSLDFVSKLFLVGFASTGLFGPWIGRLVDTCGRKAGTLAFCALYTLGALSTSSSVLPVRI